MGLGDGQHTCIYIYIYMYGASEDDTSHDMWGSFKQGHAAKPKTRWQHGSRSQAIQKGPPNKNDGDPRPPCLHASMNVGHLGDSAVEYQPDSTT